MINHPIGRIFVKEIDRQAVERTHRYNERVMRREGAEEPFALREWEEILFGHAHIFAELVREQRYINRAARLNARPKKARRHGARRGV